MKKQVFNEAHPLIIAYCIKCSPDYNPYVHYIATPMISFVRIKCSVCNGFGITLAQFFAEGDLVELTPEQRDFFLHWSALTPEQKEMLMNLVQSMK